MQRYSQTELTDYGRQLNQVNSQFATDRILHRRTPAESLSSINDPINENAGKIFKINLNNRLEFLDDNLQSRVQDARDVRLENTNSQYGGKSRKSRKGKSKKNHKKSNRTRR